MSYMKCSIDLDFQKADQKAEMQEVGSDIGYESTNSHPRTPKESPASVDECFAGMNY